MLDLEIFEIFKLYFSFTSLYFTLHFTSSIMVKTIENHTKENKHNDVSMKISEVQ